MKSRMRFDAHSPNIALPVHQSKQISQVRSRWELGEEQLRPPKLKLAHHVRLRRCRHNLDEPTAAPLTAGLNVALASKPIYPVPKGGELHASALAELALRQSGRLE